MSDEEKTTCLHEGCPVTPRTGEYCSRHKKRQRNVSALKEINAEKKKVERKPRAKSSYFFITISSNKSDEDQNDIDLIHDVNKYLFDEGNVQDFLIDKNGDELDIKKISFHSGALELSEKYGRLHFHSAIAIPKHFNMLKIDKPALIEFLTDAFGSKAYVNIEVSSSADEFENWIAYSLKDV